MKQILGPGADFDKAVKSFFVRLVKALLPCPAFSCLAHKDVLILMRVVVIGGFRNFIGIPVVVCDYRNYLVGVLCYRKVSFIRNASARNDCNLILLDGSSGKLFIELWQQDKFRSSFDQNCSLG